MDHSQLDPISASLGSIEGKLDCLITRVAKQENSLKEYNEKLERTADAIKEEAESRVTTLEHEVKTMIKSTEDRLGALETFVNRSIGVLLVCSLIIPVVLEYTLNRTHDSAPPADVSLDRPKRPLAITIGNGLAVPAGV